MLIFLSLSLSQFFFKPHGIDCYIRMIYNEVNFMQFMLDLILVFSLSCKALTSNIKFLDNDFLHLIYQETINLKWNGK